MKILKVAIIFIGLILIGCSSHTSSYTKKSNVKPYWIKDQNGCKRWNPKPAPNETITWSGECVDGYISGYGTVQWYKNGVASGTEIGEHKKGKLEGKGKIINSNEIDIGEFKNDELNGQGTVTYKNGNKYVGEWKNGDKHGYGKMFYKKKDKFAKGDKYEGMWAYSQYNGQGTLTKGTLNKNVDILYIGNWKNNKKHGTFKEFSSHAPFYWIRDYKNDKRYGKRKAFYKKNNKPYYKQSFSSSGSKVGALLGYMAMMAITSKSPASTAENIKFSNQEIERNSNCKEIEETCKSNCNIMTGERADFLIFTSTNKQLCERECTSAYHSCNGQYPKQTKKHICKSKCYFYKDDSKTRECIRDCGW